MANSCPKSGDSARPTAQEVDKFTFILSGIYGETDDLDRTFGFLQFRRNF